MKAIVLILVLLALLGVIVAILRSPRARAIFLGCLAALIPLGVIAVIFGGLYLSVGERREAVMRAERTALEEVARARTSDGDEYVVVPRGEAWRPENDSGSAEVTTPETVDSAPDAPDIPEAPPATRPNARVVLELPDDRARWKRDSVLDFQSPREKPSWVEAAAGSRYRAAYVADTDFIYWEPGPSGKLVAYGAKEATKEKALGSARNLAAGKLAALALLRLKREKRDLEAGKVRPLAERLARETVSRFVTETFVEKAHVTYANAEVHRAALLVDAADAPVRALATDIGEELRRGWLAEVERSRRALFGVVVAILLGFGVFLVYGFLNASTKGHFAWPLRIASVSLLVLLLVAAYYFRAGLWG